MIELLHRDCWKFGRGEDQTGEGCVTVGFVVADGCLWHFKFMLWELPNPFVSEDDLERLGIDRRDCAPIVERPLARAFDD
jgi:hypothetical protein